MMNTDNQPTDSYTPSRLIDSLQQRLHIRTDSELARFLGIGRPTISKIRASRCAVSAAFLIRAHEATGMDIAEMRRLYGDRRGKCRI